MNSKVVEAGNLRERPSYNNPEVKREHRSHKLDLVMECTIKFTMATHLCSGLILALIVSATVLGEPQPNGDIVTMVQEMQHANYFTFVMLLNMAQDKIPPTATFLMPSDQVLSRTPIAENKVLEFLHRHSIPSPLLFDDMQHLPTETMVPTYEADYMLRIINGGRNGFFLNNVQITSINICTAGSSFRCHGINGVLNLAVENRTASTCPNASPPTAAVGPSSAPTKSPPPVSGPPPVASSPAVASPPPPPMADPPSPAPSEFSDGFRKSKSPTGFFRLLLTIVSCLVVSTKFPFEK